LPKPTTENLESLRRHLKRLVEDEKDGGPKHHANKRAHERHLYTVEARIKYVKRFGRLSTCPDEFTVYTKDLSRSGLSFLHEHEMYVGEIIQVEVEVENTKRSFLVKLARCRRAGLKVFDVAGQFIASDEVEKAKAKSKERKAKNATKPEPQPAPKEGNHKDNQEDAEADDPEGPEQAEKASEESDAQEVEKAPEAKG